MIQLNAQLSVADAVLLKEYGEGANYMQLAKMYGTTQLKIKRRIKDALYNLTKNMEV
jgi:DNA-directed RNA polymerase specialized sigma24 family protein